MPSRQITLWDHLKLPIEPWRLELISRNLEAVQRLAYAMRKRYPGYDVEQAFFNALYLAALTFQPGRQDFQGWLYWKMQSASSIIRRKYGRRVRDGIVIVQYDPGLHDLPGEVAEMPDMMPDAREIWTPQRGQEFEFRGEIHNMRGWSVVTGIPYMTLVGRRHLGWDIARVLTAPVRPRKASK